MRKISLKTEAASCRAMAKDFVGRPEGPFLLRIASELDELALLSGRARLRRGG